MWAKHSPWWLQILADLSSEAEAIKPLVLVATLYTMAVWPMRLEMTEPWKSQTFSVMSCEADTMPNPSSKAKPLHKTYFKLYRSVDSLSTQYLEAHASARASIPNTSK